MSARRLSIESRMTLPSSGGFPGGGGGRAAGTQPPVAAPADALPAGAAEAVATATGSADTPGGGASFEQAATSTAPRAEVRGRRMARTLSARPRRRRQIEG